MFKKLLHFTKLNTRKLADDLRQCSPQTHDFSSLVPHSGRNRLVRLFSATRLPPSSPLPLPLPLLSGLQHLLPAHLLPEMGRAGERGRGGEDTGAWLQSGQEEGLL